MNHRENGRLASIALLAGLCTSGMAHAFALSGRVTDAATGQAFAKPTVTAWTYGNGPALALPDGYDAASGDHVAYASASDTRIGARAFGYGEEPSP